MSDLENYSARYGCFIPYMAVTKLLQFWTYYIFVLDH